jgi:hypothetical protein
MASVVPYNAEGVRGFLHEAPRAEAPGLVLAHGAGSDCRAPLLVEAAKAFAAAGVAVLRCDLAFRQQRPTGPPRGSAAADRASLRAAAAALRRTVRGPVFLGGHSYGGRQASMLAADEPGVAAALLLFSYPLHPPKQPERLRTEHFPRLRTRTVFVHGSADGFATGAELDAAVALIPAATRVIRIAGAGHDLKRGRIDYAPIVAEFVDRAG